MARGLLLAHALKHNAGSRTDTSGALGDEAALEALGRGFGPVELDGLLRLARGRWRAAPGEHDRGDDQ